jgi:hypothetical protein
MAKTLGLQLPGDRVEIAENQNWGGIKLLLV